MSEPHPHPWHSASVFGDGPRQPLNREQRARFRYLLNAHRRSDHLPAKQFFVGDALLRRLSVDGRCDPSHATLAKDAACCERTVGRAIGRLRDLGLLHWQRRIIRAGRRVSQTSNAYILVPTGAAPAPRFRAMDSRSMEPIPSESFILLSVSADVLEARAALAKVAARREAALLEKWLGRRRVAMA